VDAERAALLAEIEALNPESARKSEMPANHGKPWNYAEKEAVAELFEQDMPIREIAHKHGRSVGGIRSELIRQGLIERQEPTLISPPADKKIEVPEPESTIAPRLVLANLPSLNISAIILPKK
jgi:transposase-like protein